MSSGEGDDGLFPTYLPYVAVFVLSVQLCVLLCASVLLDKKRERSRGFESLYHSQSLLEQALQPDAHASDVFCAYSTGMLCCCCTGRLCPCLCCCKTWRDVCDFGKKPILFATALYESRLCGAVGSALLLLLRLGALAVLTICNVYLYFLVRGGSMRRFGSWNNVLVSFYFALSSQISVTHIRICERSDPLAYRESSTVMEKLAAFTLVLYAVVTTNSFFITILKYVYYDPDISQQGLIEHVLPSVALVLDMIFNDAPFRAEHYQYALVLPVLYLLYMWAREIQGVFGVQYSFLQTYSNDSFFNYSMLFLVHLGCHFAAWLMHRVRDYFSGVEYRDRHRMGFGSDSSNIDASAPSYHEVDVEIMRQVPTADMVR